MNIIHLSLAEATEMARPGGCVRNEFLDGDADEMHVYGFFFERGSGNGKWKNPHAKARLGS